MVLLLVSQLIVGWCCREADDLKDSLNQSEMTCDDLEKELEGTGADEGLLAEENQRLQVNAPKLLNAAAIGCRMLLLP